MQNTFHYNLDTFVVLGIVCIDRYNCNYHVIVAMTIWHEDTLHILKIKLYFAYVLLYIQNGFVSVLLVFFCFFFGGGGGGG